MRGCRFGAALAALCAAGLATAAPAETFRRRADHVLGTSLDVAVTADHPATADAADAAIRAEIDRLAAVLSAYDPHSEISRLDASPGADVSPDLLAVLRACEDWRARTEGAFSCRIGRLIAAWRAAEAGGAAPERAALRRLAGEIRRAGLTLDAAARHVVRPETVVFDVDGIATGYILDAALAAAQAAAPEARGILIDIGGDIRVWGEGDEGAGWRIGVPAAGARADNAPAELMLGVADGAVTTSGAGPRDRVIAGTAYGRILSPESGWPVDHVAASTVVAPDALTADALATSLVVMEIARGLALAESLDGVEARIVAADGRAFRTTGWAALAPPESGGAGARRSALPKGFELRVGLEIPKIAAGGDERPYVAVWIAGPDRKLVRVLALWGDEPRWIEENYVWHRRFGRYAGSLVDALARPTRPPGAYVLVWDGRTDDGAAAAPGAYVLHVEAAREHGGHQHEALDLAIGDAPFEAGAPAGAELGAIEVSYGAPK